MWCVWGVFCLFGVFFLKKVTFSGITFMLRKTKQQLLEKMWGFSLSLSFFTLNILFSSQSAGTPYIILYGGTKLPVAALTFATSG